MTEKTYQLWRKVLLTVALLITLSAAGYNLYRYGLSQRDKPKLDIPTTLTIEQKRDILVKLMPNMDAYVLTENDKQFIMAYIKELEDMINEK